ncbi:hypothetical protein GSI_08874 [Ganoderma sinense ZZ0214-1]|uniref:F-box domain-containing protein n=1 Tax=Ganoderma sinense ZZ0214-1 TaxID=1077348 RepID=A0A2G8S4W5_9APHY|nr:hypothetical protein GSI_08874 [Ganoderma sinense ZZ0214-1]
MLRTRPIVLRLKNVATILGFHDFLFSDLADRLPHVVALVIHVAEGETHPSTECSGRAIEALVAILRDASSLKSLELRSSAEWQSLGYLDDLRLSAVIEEVASLRELTIGGRTEVANFIGAIRSPLTKLAVGVSISEVRLDEGQWSPDSFGAALSRITPSLQTLAITKSYVRLIGGPPDSVSALTPFHALRSLTLSWLVVVPQLPLLFALSPNLDGTLHITMLIHGSPVSAGLEERYNFFRTAREQNSLAQEHKCWTRLHRLICDVEALFALSLRCPVGLTIVHECPTHAVPATRRYITESFRDHPPTHLNLQPMIWWGPDEPSLAGMFPPEAAATLTHLTLCVQCDYDSVPGATPLLEEMLRWDDLWRGTFLPALAPLRSLTHFRLVFHCEAREPEVPAWPISEDPFVEDLRPTGGTSRFDFAAMAAALVDALPALRYCFLTNSARLVEMKLSAGRTFVERWRESRAWRVACTPTGLDGVDDLQAVAAVDAYETRRELVELDDDIAEAIIDRGDLVLSTEEKASAVNRSSRQ